MSGPRASIPPPRFVISEPTPAPEQGGLLRITGAELHHMRDVMRLGEGAAVELISAGGVEYKGRIVSLGAHEATVQLAPRVTAAPARERARLILAPAIIKGPRMDFLVEKAAELGAAELWPLVCAHGIIRVAGAERALRWRRLALAAAKQSRTARAMRVREPIGFDRLIDALTRDSVADSLTIICTPGAPPLLRALEERRARTVTVICGPEGDFDPDERRRAERAGVLAVGLGPSRLRSETAALKALSLCAGMLLDDEEPQGS